MGRNLREDLAICNEAMENSCTECGWTFIAEARTGWPHAIERALDAEMKVAQMERRLRAVESTVERMLDSYGCQDFWDFVMEYESEEVGLDDKV
ncbi:hypothetical protein GOP56_11360 [Brevibacillus sp. 7WMA2]|uniref:hypothetical protein n=1 Tax=Brevibacillus sp. 7WMA2 TaxID=2683193 RepID=UPI0013A7142C|nr:hypothetical protein [Brevibacillus sp. 7WMA2]QIC06152.1 hypothetical protein GOP56_11360 [Brevibacillus sp. 7WMA2]